MGILDEVKVEGYQVLDANKEWVAVENPVELNDGALRYMRDGYGMTAKPGEWRAPREIAEKLHHQQQQFAKGRALWVIAFVVIFVLGMIIDLCS